MFSSAEKTSTVSCRQQQPAQGSFFRKAGDPSFFGEQQQTGFFIPGIQAKLTVSSPDDPQEKEADNVADQVMRMAVPAGPAPQQQEEEKLQRKEAEKEETATVQPKQESPAISIQCKEEETEVQAKLFNPVQRSQDDSVGADTAEITTGIAAENTIARKNISLYRSDMIQCSGRGPPAGIMSFEHNLSSSRGLGSPMPGSTQQFMENRFNADFSGVRIHTGSYAENLSSGIHAQAFAHGNDIYFNSGKYAPHTEVGQRLLAHELTHTIQQGASTPLSAGKSTTAPASSVARKNIIQRSPAGVPSQLTNAVEKAKTAEGKIDANKPQPDGLRTGWESLLDIFKTTFGADKIVGSGGAAIPGAVAEQDIKKKREQSGVMVVDKTTVTGRNAIPKTTTGSRDAMPSWCGIFVFWALNKSGVPMPKWKLGERMIKPEAARAPGVAPLPGDIAYRNAYSHFAIVESAAGGTVKTVNGNTAGEDNLGGQVQAIEHPVSDWTAFFNPLLIMEGSLGSGDGTVEEKPKTLRELRRELFNVNRKEEPEQETQPADKIEQATSSEIQAEPATGAMSVNSSGQLTAHTPPAAGTQEAPVQCREEEKQPEEEKIMATRQPSLQRMADTALHCKEGTANTLGAGGAAPAIDRCSACNTTHDENETANNTGTVAVVHDRGPPVVHRSSGQKVQCGWFDTALSFVDSAIDFVAEGLEAGKRLLLSEARDFVMAIPGYRALRVVLGEDPVTGELVDRNGHNFIEAAFDIMPGGRLLHQKLSELGALEDAAAWIDTQIQRVITLVSEITTRVANFWDGLTLDSLAHPTEIFEQAGNIIHAFINSVVDFAVAAALELVEIVKRFLLTQLVDFVRNHTTAYPLLTVILEHDPITEAHVDRNGTNILNALLELGGEEGRLQRTQMQETGTFQKVADWIDRGIAVFGNLYTVIRNNFGMIWTAITSIETLMHPVDTFNRIYETFAEPVSQVWQFVRDAARVILQFIKEALMRRLSGWARTVRGYPLVTVLIGRDPFTGDRVPRTIPNIIRGFMSLMEGGEEQYRQMEESGAIARTTQRINAAVARLNMTPAYIIGLFTALWNSFSLNDLVRPVEAFQRIVGTFGEPIGRLIDFVVEIIKIVVHVILEIMNFPFDLINNIITRAMAAFDRIKRDPIAFLKNLLRAIKQGFIQFFDNILTHLLNGVVGWLMSELRDANVPQPQDLSLRGIISWVLEVLGISMDAIWQKLAAHPRIGPQRVARLRSMISTLEGIWTFIKDVQERGIAAIWDKIQEQLSNLWNTVLDAVKNWIMERIITQVTVKLLSMLDPTGIMAVINSAIAIYRAIQSFMRYLRQMLEVVNSFVNGVADIAEGNVTTAANYLENTMGRAMPIVVGFLANQVGLSGVGRRIAEMITSVRGLVDRALTWLVNKAVDTGFAIFDRLMNLGRSAVAGIRSLLGLEENYTNEAGENHTILIQDVAQGQLQVKRASTPEHISVFLANKQTQLNTPGSSLAGLPNDRKAEIASAITEALGLVSRIEAISYPANAPAQSTQHLQQQMNTLLATLKRKIQVIDKEASPVPPVAVVPGFSSNLATTLNVKYLLKGHHTPGTPADNYLGNMHEATPILENIGLYPNKWVNFHLLNHNYGGLAVDSNLVPTPTGINNNYKDSFEDSFKDKYDPPGGATSPKVMWFDTQVTYRSGTVFAQTITANGGAMKPSGREWIPDPQENIAPWSRTIPPPVAESIAINKLPPRQDLIRQMARYTPMTQDLLVLLARIKPRVVVSHGTLLSMLANYARSGAIDAATHSRYIQQINATTFDFST